MEGHTIYSNESCLDDFVTKRNESILTTKKKKRLDENTTFFVCFLGMDPTMPYIQEAKLLFLTIIVLMKEDVTNV